MPDGLNWGIIGTGFIGQKLAEAMTYVPGAKLWSVASRSAERAAWFAERYGAQKHYTSIEAFAADSALDVAYIATPHPNHMAETVLCLNAGKHVLCEKPLAMNTGQVQAMQAAARANHRFLMEAMWMWFIPATIRAKEMIAAGAVGTPSFLTAQFGFPHSVAAERESRFFNPALGGGSLLDQGVYTLALMLYLFGKPESFSTYAHICETGVDDEQASLWRYADGRTASAVTSLRSYAANDAIIAGSTGHLRIHPRFWYSQRLSVHRRDQPDEVIDVPYEGNAYNYEVAEVMRCIAAGKTESEVMSWQASLDLMGMMDSLRAEWGLRYPSE